MEEPKKEEETSSLDSPHETSQEPPVTEAAGDFNAGENTLKKDNKVTEAGDYAGEQQQDSQAEDKKSEEPAGEEEAADEDVKVEDPLGISEEEPPAEMSNMSEDEADEIALDDVPNIPSEGTAEVVFISAEMEGGKLVKDEVMQAGYFGENMEVETPSKEESIISEDDDMSIHPVAKKESQESFDNRPISQPDTPSLSPRSSPCITPIVSPSLTPMASPQMSPSERAFYEDDPMFRLTDEQEEQLRRLAMEQEAAALEADKQKKKAKRKHHKRRPKPKPTSTSSDEPSESNEPMTVYDFDPSKARSSLYDNPVPSTSSVYDNPQPGCSFHKEPKHSPSHYTASRYYDNYSWLRRHHIKPSKKYSKEAEIVAKILGKPERRTKSADDTGKDASDKPPETDFLGSRKAKKIVKVPPKEKVEDDIEWEFTDEGEQAPKRSKFCVDEDDEYEYLETHIVHGAPGDLPLYYNPLTDGYDFEPPRIRKVRVPIGEGGAFHGPGIYYDDVTGTFQYLVPFHPPESDRMDDDIKWDVEDDSAYGNEPFSEHTDDECQVSSTSQTRDVYEERPIPFLIKISDVELTKGKQKSGNLKIPEAAAKKLLEITERLKARASEKSLEEAKPAEQPPDVKMEPVKVEIPITPEIMEEVKLEIPVAPETVEEMKTEESKMTPVEGTSESDDLQAGLAQDENGHPITQRQVADIILQMAVIASLADTEAKDGKAQQIADEFPAATVGESQEEEIRLDEEMPSTSTNTGEESKDEACGEDSAMLMLMEGMNNLSLHSPRTDRGTDTSQDAPEVHETETQTEVEDIGDNYKVGRLPKPGDRNRPHNKDGHGDN